MRLLAREMMMAMVINTFTSDHSDTEHIVGQLRIIMAKDQLTVAIQVSVDRIGKCLVDFIDDVTKYNTQVLRQGAANSRDVDRVVCNAL